jgi:hypothetical protein
VKQKIKLKIRFFALIAALLTILNACNDTSDLGMDLLPSTDLIEVKNLVEKDKFSAYTFTEGPLQTDEPSRSLLGSFNDPVFGISTIDFATQFRLFDMPDYGTNPVADSVKLFLYYRLVYGDTITPQTFSVYELDTYMDIDDTYSQDIDLSAYATDFLLGQRTYTPVVRLDSASRDTFFQLISIPLDISLGEKLVNAPDSLMADNDVFLQYFKGLLIKSTPQTTAGGSILTLEAVYSNNWQGSALVVYYNNDENIAEEEPDTLLNPYLISPFSVRVNEIRHDYSGTAFFNNLNQDTSEDSLIYVQATGGLKSKIYIDQLSSWRDSANVAINKAELVFQVDTVRSEVDKYPPPSQLLFTYVNEDGEERLPADFAFSPLFYGGRIDTTDHTYRFNITQHLQEILDGDVTNNGFFLSAAYKNNEANRVVLKGSSSQTGIQLIVTYSKFLQ